MEGKAERRRPIGRGIASSGRRESDEGSSHGCSIFVKGAITQKDCWFKGKP